MISSGFLSGVEAFHRSSGHRRGLSRQEERRNRSQRATSPWHSDRTGEFWQCYPKKCLFPPPSLYLKHISPYRIVNEQTFFFLKIWQHCIKWSIWSGITYCKAIKKSFVVGSYCGLLYTSALGHVCQTCVLWYHSIDASVYIFALRNVPTLCLCLWDSVAAEPYITGFITSLLGCCDGDLFLVPTEPLTGSSMCNIQVTVCFPRLFSTSFRNSKPHSWKRQ